MSPYSDKWGNHIEEWYERKVRQQQQRRRLKPKPLTPLEKAIKWLDGELAAVMG